MRITVIGTFNIDCVGTSSYPLHQGESHPGKIKISAGGVARNIVENLARLGLDISFITAVGFDANGVMFKKELEDLGVKFIMPENSKKHLTSTYLAINNGEGQLEYAVVETSILAEICPLFLKKHLDEINQSDVVLIDTNLTEEAIEYLFENVRVPIAADAVSEIKANKLKKYLDRLTLLKVNKHEMEVLAKDLEEKHPDNLIITSGKDDLIYIKKDDDSNYVTKKYSPLPAFRIVNTTGAGDALLAGIIYGMVKEHDLEKGITLGLKMSQLTLEVHEAVNREVKRLLNK